jgi:hypothetical protein
LDIISGLRGSGVQDWAVAGDEPYRREAPLTDNSETRSARPEQQFLHVVVDAVHAELGPEEAIIQIRRGRTRYGKQTYVYFLVDIATLALKSGNEPAKRRTRVVELNVDSPLSAKLHDPLWVPYDHLYG